MGDDSPVELSYCVVNTNGRDELLACLDAIRATHPAGEEAEILVLDNASDDGSAEAVRAWIERSAAASPPARLITRERRGGKAENDTLLLREARGELCLLLNEDSELRPDATEALLEAVRADPRVVAAGAQLYSPAGEPLACAWRLPGLATALAQALFLHRRLVTRSGDSRGERRGPAREVGWVQSAAMLVRREAVAAVGYLDPRFFVYSDETDLCKRLRDAGGRVVHVPAAEAIHHEQLSTDRAAGERRAIEFHRGRDLYMRKHHSTLAAFTVRVLSAWAYLPRALAALVLPRHDAGWYWLHARRALRPWHGEGMREAADAHNRRLTSEQALAARAAPRRAAD